MTHRPHYPTRLPQISGNKVQPLADWIILVAALIAVVLLAIHAAQAPMVPLVHAMPGLNETIDHEGDTPLSPSLATPPSPPRSTAQMEWSALRDRDYVVPFRRNRLQEP